MEKRFENLSNVRLGELLSNARRHGQAAKLAALAGGLVVVVPLVALALAGVIVAVMTFIAASVLLRAFDGLGRIFNGVAGVVTPKAGEPRGDGRVNVRVIHREGT